ncbi:mannan endo-1,4-beta-mannosidase-like [Mercenaria mercenaria]|uniref:mannan endo-1,4-beta-mannosidase-like n=1 Tax=Mercenaria mercenaria TaxID=6596 RepID=UPI00234E3C44|nr:mannan endo-1,4-beta-mannosidase-like [Mercenaria mercenaria]
MANYLGIFYLLSLSYNYEVLAQKYLTVNGTNFMLNGEKVFLSGVNQAWYRYGGDFGNKSYVNSKPHLVRTFDALKANGGNSIRMWVHTSGGNTPAFNSTGHVTGPGPNTTRDLLDYVREAQSRNILVTFSLWNAVDLKAGLPIDGLLQDESILQSYITNALIPIVRALKQQREMAIWEIMNEPEGSMLMETEDKTEPCYDTSTIHLWDFADWTRQSIPLKNFLRFIGLQASAIHREDPKSLVTVGSWTYKSITNALDRRNFYSDYCLQRASDGEPGARLDLYQIHTYDTFYIYLPHDPFMVDASVYKLDKPIIIGEFSQKKGGFLTSPEQFTWAYNHGYNGAWSWSAIDSDDAADTLAVQETGLRSLKDKNDQSKGGRVNINLQETEVTRCFLYILFGYIAWIADIIFVL